MELPTQAEGAAPVPAEAKPAGETKPVVPGEVRNGTIVNWVGTYGFLKDDETENQHFFHSQDVITEDRTVRLRPNMEVQFKLRDTPPEKSSKEGEKRAYDVQCRDGTPISWLKKCGEKDDFERVLLHPEDQFFDGMCYFYDPNEDYGLCRLNQVVNLEEHKITFTPDDDICAAGQDFTFQDDFMYPLPVKFQLYKEMAQYGASNLTKTGEQGTSPLIDGKPKRFKGIVRHVKPHYFVSIQPQEDLRYLSNGYLPMGGGIPGCCYEINTEDRPAIIDKGTEVTFEVGIWPWGQLVALKIADAEGNPLKSAEGYKKHDNNQSEKDVTPEKEYKGTINNYNWQTGVGWIAPNEGEVPEEIWEKNKNKKGGLFFHRNEIASEDKISGVLIGTEIRFRIYEDEKGLGGYDVRPAETDKFSGVMIPQEYLQSIMTYQPRGRNWRGRGRRRGGPGYGGYGVSYGGGYGRGGYAPY